MKFQKTIASLSLAGVLALGYAGVAGAATTTPTPTTSTTPTAARCEHAQDVLAHLRTRDAEVKVRIAKAEVRRDALAAQGKTAEAAKLTKRIDEAKDRLGKVEARVDKVADAVAKRCATH